MPSDSAPALGRGRSYRRDPSLDKDLSQSTQDPELSQGAGMQQQGGEQQAREQQGEGQRLHALGRTRPSEEAHSALSASLHQVFGNALMQGALSGRETGPGQVIEGAMTLGAAGVAVADDSAGLFSNSAVQGFMAQGAIAAAAGATGGEAGATVARRAEGEVFHPEAEQRLGTALSREGAQMPAGLSARLGAAFGGVDFSDVRIHTDAAAVRASQAINAHAFTVGTDVYFNQGAFNPATPEGQHLLAHELTHVVQHQEGRLRPGGGGEMDVSSPTDPHELEAETRAAEVTRALGDGSAEAALQAPAPEGPALDGGTVGGGLEGSAGSAGAASAGSAQAAGGAGGAGVGGAGLDGAGLDGAIHRRRSPGRGGGGSSARGGGARSGGGGGARSGGGRPGRSAGGAGDLLGGAGDPLGGAGDLLGGASELLGDRDAVATTLVDTLTQAVGDQLSVQGTGVEGLAEVMAAALGSPSAPQTTPGGTGVGEGATGSAGGASGGGARESWSVRKGQAGSGKGEGSGPGVRLEGEVPAFTRDLLQVIGTAVASGQPVDADFVLARLTELFPDQMDPELDMGVEGRNSEETGKPQTPNAARPDGDQGGEQISGGFRGGGDVTRRGAADSEGFDPLAFVDNIVQQFNALGEGDVGPMVQQVLQGQLAELVPGFEDLLGQAPGRGGGGTGIGPGGGMGGVSGLLADALPMPGEGGPGQAVSLFAGQVDAPAIESRLADTFGARGEGPRGPAGRGRGVGAGGPSAGHARPGGRGGVRDESPTAPYSNSQRPDWAANDPGMATHGQGGPGQAGGARMRPGAAAAGAGEEQAQEQAGGQGQEQGGQQAQDAQQDTGTGGAGQGVQQPQGQEQEQQQGGSGAQAGGATQVDGAPAAAGGAPALDGLVDYYMETHWDRTDYDAKVAEYGVVPDGQGTELDHWLPADTSPGVRGGLNIAFGIAGGVLDGLFKSLVTSLPVVGIFANVAYGIKDIWEAHEAYKDVEGGRGTALYWVNIVRDVVDLVGGVVGSIDDTLTYAEDLCAASVVGAPIAAILAAIGEVASTIGLICDGIKTTLDIASAIMNIMEANEAQRDGDYRRAAKHRDLARSDVMDAIVDGIAFTAEAVSMITANAVPDDIVENVAEGTAQTVKETSRTTKTLGQHVTDAMTGISRGSDGSINGVKTAGKQIGRWNSSAQAIGGAFDSYNNVMYNIGLGDAMLYGTDGAFGGHVIEPGSLSGSGSATGPLAQARQQTVTQFQESWGQLEGADPKWYQKLINDILNPAEGTALDAYKAALSPSTWIATAFSGVRHAAILLGDGGIEAVAGTLRGAASMLQTVAEPAIATVNTWIAEMEPALDAMLENMAGALEKQTASLEWLRGTVDGVQGFLEIVNELADQGGTIDSAAESLISSVEGMQIDGDDLGIPSWVPDFTYEWLFDGINSAISGIAGEARELKSGALSGIDSFVQDRTSWAQEQLSAIEQAIAEGGELETMLQEGVESFTQSLAEFARIVADWDMTIELDLPGTVDYLEGLASALNDATHESRTEDFHEFLRNEAQSIVDEWKAEHTDDVNQAYYPEVPAHEVEAVQQAWRLIDARLSELEAGEGGAEAYGDARQEAQAAYEGAMAQAGQRGQGAITTFWSGADALARIASGLGL